MGPEFCREMRRGEEAAVDDLLRAAFGGDDEARLVAALRKNNEIAGEMVLPLDGRIVGYYALSYFSAPEGWLCLAPVAIAPDLQGQRHGKRMVGLLGAWAAAARAYVVVLGDAAFYGQCGFSSGRAARLTSPYPIGHTLLAGPGTDVPAQTLNYPAAFKDL